jgi:hypothetical protein
MEWSELPQEYKDLREGFKDFESNYIWLRFIWNSTKEDDNFWKQCHLAKTINELPTIKQTKQ